MMDTNLDPKGGAHPSDRALASRAQGLGPAGFDPSRGAEADMSWFLIGVRRGGRDIVILDNAPGWDDFDIEFYWEDTFACDPPRHLAPGAYRWSGFKIGWWAEDDAINVSGGTFTRDSDGSPKGRDAEGGSTGTATARAEGIAQPQGGSSKGTNNAE